MIYCELLHLKTQKIWAATHEVKEDSITYMTFQNEEDPAWLGYTFVRDYDTQEANTTTEPVRTDTTGASALWD
jgi:hypothetical protein